MQDDQLRSVVRRNSISVKRSSWENLQIIVGVLISICTIYVSLKTYSLSEATRKNSEKLSEIESALNTSKFDFERYRDIYDRAEKYLSSDHQNERQGRALVALIGILPSSHDRDELLSIFVREAQVVSVAASAADVNDQTAGQWTLSQKSFSGSFALIKDPLRDSFLTADDLIFTDSSGVKWPLPRGTVIDGTAIPRSLWSTVGSPINGKIAPATALYQYQVSKRTSPVKNVNKMYYEALIASQVPEQQATTLLAAVDLLGPRWNVLTK
ncbi:DUF1353 domain-containing protein [Mesorhizobium sp. B2-4-19]|uniref:DUF1353 domain-containing protein n=1 Tax=Mesorhizobium sp. B2-4-19 TaxID=2589930 RepID=UPI00112B7EF2|nr:DUF1353 domain-containing protein [Mesorhizobium sp. B2-4-19]TPK60606.1 DUF1353 domain-containing protein [Mesorhizobium sp. B2-4-19]